MVTEKQILDMYVHLRKTNSSIPDEALDFMKETCLAKLNENTEIFVCTDFNLILNDMKMRQKKITQLPTAEIFTIQISKR